MYPRQDNPRAIPQPPSSLPASAGFDQHSSPVSATSSTTASSQTLNMHGYPSAQPAPSAYSNNQRTHDPLAPYIGIKNDRSYTLKVEQQPVRARMCGFGDKDRRPITPPPCIRLIVKDAKTGKELDFTEVDSTFFVLTVDLWSADGTSEVNLVRHSTGAPTVSISTSTVTSYPPQPERPIFLPQSLTYPGSIPQAMQSNVPGYGAVAPPMQQHYYGHPTASPIAPPMYQYSPVSNAQGYQPQISPLPVQQVTSPPATGMFTRNLIGSLTVNAFRLNDTEGKVGFWFVLQDLSVRTEGQFRLKMNFVDVGTGGNNNVLNTGRAPVLASCFSDVFQVYSAKKFPGVIESTPLSRVFASQGIKIPIRKDGPKTLSNQAEYDNDD